MVVVAIPCPRCRAVRCVCGYIAQREQELAMRRKVRGERQRQVRPYDSAERRMHAYIISEHVAAHGWVCPGAAELGHAPHRVVPGTLDVDDVLPVSRGGDRRDARNKRVLCRSVNRGRRV